MSLALMPTGRYVPILPAGLIAKPLPESGDPDRLKQMLFEGAPPSAMKVYHALDELGRYRTDGHGMHRAAWVTIPTIVAMTKELGDEVKDPTVRVTALPWLIEHGWVSLEHVEYRGNARTLFWCHWLLPFDPAGHEADLGQDCLPSPEPRRKAGRKPKATRPRDHPLGPEGAGSGAPKTAPNSSYELGLNNRKRRQTGRTSSSSAALQGDGEGTQADRPEVPMPAAPTPPPAESSPMPPCPGPAAPAEIDPAIDPAIAATLEAKVPDPADRDDMAARIPEWSAKCAAAAAKSRFTVVEWIIRMILESAAARAKRAQTPRPVKNLAGFADGTLDNWIKDGQPTLRAAREAMPFSGKTAEMVKAEAETQARERRARDDVAKEAEARERRARAKWEAMTAEEQRRLREECGARWPEIAANSHPAFRKIAEVNGCLEILREREAVSS